MTVILSLSSRTLDLYPDMAANALGQSNWKMLSGPGSNISAVDEHACINMAPQRAWVVVTVLRFSREQDTDRAQVAQPNGTPQVPGPN